MQIRASISNEQGHNRVTLCTNENERSLDIPPKSSGFGSSANGGELLFLALATCYCNDVYREAGKSGIDVLGVDVEVDGEFGAPGEPARNITYRTRIRARGAGRKQLAELLQRTDTLAEVHNTLRAGTDVRLVGQDIEIVD
jgi:organic hydroperoxide reductase OsmC/OhrA